jgi:hypothetical protein
LKRPIEDKFRNNIHLECDFFILNTSVVLLRTYNIAHSVFK